MKRRSKAPASSFAVQRRMQALVQGLASQLAGLVHCTPPAVGMFVWATFAQSIEPQALFDAFVSCQVLYVPGKAFFPESAQVHAMRLSFAAPEVPQIEQAGSGCRRRWHRSGAEDGGGVASLAWWQAASSRQGCGRYRC